MTGLAIFVRRCWWRASYHGHLSLLSLLALLRWVFFGLAVLAHRGHTGLAAHGQVVADVLGETDFAARTKPRSDRYTRVAYFLLPDTPEDT